MKTLTDLEKAILRVFHFEGVSMSAIEVANSLKSEGDDSHGRKKELHQSFNRLKTYGYIVQDKLLGLEDGVSKYCLSEAGMLKSNQLKIYEPSSESVFDGMKKGEVITKDSQRELSAEIPTTNTMPAESSFDVGEKTNLDFLNNALVEQIRRLDTSSNSTPERMALEINKAKAMASVAKSITENIKVEVEVHRMKKEGSIEELPKMMRVIEGG